MRVIFTYILSILVHSTLLSQVLTAGDFIAIASLSEKKSSSYIEKKGFTQTGKNFDDGVVTNEFYYYQKKKGKEKQVLDTVLRFVSGFSKGKNTGIIYKTSSFNEYDSILKDFKINGFIAGKEGKDSILFFQKGDMTVHIQQTVEEDVKFYQVRLDKTPVPSLSSVKFADDLLEFDSHESLVLLFGKDNVKKDIYYFSQDEFSHCSILYPNTSRQAYFFWDDEKNSRKLSYLLIGGVLRAEGSSEFNKTIGLNAWRSYSGLYTGMKVSEILRYNNSDFNFFGLNSEFAFMAVPEKKGNIDFKRTGIVLECFNCNNTSFLKADKVSAQEANDEGLQLYIVSIILLPSNDRH